MDGKFKPFLNKKIIASFLRFGIKTLSLNIHFKTTPTQFKLLTLNS